MFQQAFIPDINQSTLNVGSFSFVIVVEDSFMFERWTLLGLECKSFKTFLT